MFKVLDRVYKLLNFAIRRESQLLQFLDALNDRFERLCDTQRLQNWISFGDRKLKFIAPLVAHKRDTSSVGLEMQQNASDDSNWMLFESVTTIHPA